MAKLKAKRRNELPSSAFGLPKQRKYPENDREHAILAEGRATEMEHRSGRGHLSAAQAAQIRAKAKRILGR